MQTTDWLRAHRDAVDRVLYHFGNSPFHEHMLDLLADVPGVVVLHDFYLSSLLAYLEEHARQPHRWTRALYFSHGYDALHQRFAIEGGPIAKHRFPSNLEFLRHAQGVIVHAEFSRTLAKQFYGCHTAQDWAVVPMVRQPARMGRREEARKKLEVGPEVYLVCSFGFLDPSKCNERLLHAWMESTLAQDPACHLVFVGENHGGDYGGLLQAFIAHHPSGQRVRITGWADLATYQAYLAAADLAVQLRTTTRGETSAAVFDCLNYGLPTIVNAHGSLSELPDDAVYLLPDDFSTPALVKALDEIRNTPEQQRRLSERGAALIHSRHQPQACAQHYFDHIEAFHQQSLTGLDFLLKRITKEWRQAPTHSALSALAVTLATSLPGPKEKSTLYLDISATARTDLKTGIERVTRALLLALIANPPDGFRVEPIYLSDEGGAWHYRLARHYTLSLIGGPPDALDDDVAEFTAGDILLGLDLSGDRLVAATAVGLILRLRQRGVRVHYIVYDLLPLLLPHAFPSGFDEHHSRWLAAVGQTDGAICISRTVASDLTQWHQSAGLNDPRFRIGSFQLASDIDNTAPTRGTPREADTMRHALRARPSFLMVGTIEPRKKHLCVLAAFDELWATGVQANLIIVGKEGWQALPNDQRRDIPVTIERLRHHPEKGTRLHWLENASDEFLEEIYQTTTCLIAASENEGFGLPLVEAARHGLPIIATDIPIFREVAGNDSALYFSSGDSAALAECIRQWLHLYKQGKHPRSTAIPSVSWQESARQIVSWLMLN